MIRYGLSSIAQRAPVLKPATMLDELGERSPTEKILELITEAADKGLPCPPNAKLADGSGLIADVEASRRVSILESRGLIKVERPAVNIRIVTIVATGRKTAMPVFAPKRTGHPAERTKRRIELEERLYAFLCKAADDGRQMPFQRDMASHLGFISAGGARYYLKMLIKRGLIRVKARRLGVHVYTITKTGQELQASTGACKLGEAA